jgi:hypothetical protein
LLFCFGVVQELDISADEIFKKMIDAAEGAFDEGWETVKVYAPAEFKKMSVQLIEIVENVSLYEIDKTQGYSLKQVKFYSRCKGRLVRAFWSLSHI